MIINYFINIENNPSASRTFGFIRFIFFIFAIYYIIESSNINYKNILYFWFALTIFISLDTYIQFFTGKNLLGYESFPMGNINRLSSFLRNEYKIAGFLYPFCLISIGLLLERKNNIFFLCFIFSFFLTIIFLTGERANFYLFTLSCLILFFVSNIKYEKKFIILIIFLVNILILSLVFVPETKRQLPFISHMIGNQTKLYDNNNNLKNSSVNLEKIEKFKLFKDTHYASHYLTAYKIFIDNPFFGTGIKTFRNVCSKDKYSHNLKNNDRRCSTHPHNVILEFLSEIGLIGFLIFLAFILMILFNSLKYIISNRSPIFLSFFIYFIFSFFPFLPKGSFFTNWNATIFWTFFSIMFLILKKNIR